MLRNNKDQNQVSKSNQRKNIVLSTSQIALSKKKIKLHQQRLIYPKHCTEMALYRTTC